MSSSESEDDKQIKKSKKFEESNKSEKSEMRQADKSQVEPDLYNSGQEIDPMIGQMPNQTDTTQEQSSNRADTEPHNIQEEQMKEETDEERTVFIKGLTIDITKTSAMRMTQRIGEIVGTLKAIQKSKDSLKVICMTMNDKIKLMNVKTLLGHTIIATEPFQLKRRFTQPSHLNRGIIFGVHKEITNEEMSMSIGLRAERILKKRGPNTITTEQMIVYCETELPPFVYDGWNRYKVSIYIPDPTHC